MHENQISHSIIGAAIEVHRNLGPGLVESLYEEALCYEFDLCGIGYERQVALPVVYKGKTLAKRLRTDMIVEKKVIVEIKAKEVLAPSDKPQLLTYLKTSNLGLGLILNFNAPVIKDGIVRIVNNLKQ